MGPLRRTITGTSLASGILLVLMGAATLYVGLAYDAMPTPSGWQATLSVRLQHYGQTLTEALSWVPGWAAAVLLLVVVALLAWRALKQVTAEPVGKEKPHDESESKEEILEHES